MMTGSTNPLEGKLVAAVQLGWRVAELYALVDDTGEPSSDTLLPAHSSLGPADQVELQLRAAAGDARRAGVASKSASLDGLVECARESPFSREATEAFRAQLRRCHIEIDKDLWAADEGAGKAYELGNGLADTYGRICRSYRHSEEAPPVAWREVFGAQRIERVKKLLDDLQSRLNAGGVTVVKHQLDTWSRELPRRIEERGLPPVERVPPAPCRRSWPSRARSGSPRRWSCWRYATACTSGRSCCGTGRSPRKVTNVTLTLGDLLAREDPGHKAIAEAAGRFARRVRETVHARREPANP